jgi:hypothetical protein
MQKIRCAAFAVALVLLGPGVKLPWVHARGLGTQAAEDPPASNQTARLFEAARAALSARDVATAHGLASRCFRAAPSAEALFLLGMVALQENRLLAAQDLMRRYLAAPDLDEAADSTEQQQAQRVLERPRPPAALLNVLGDRGTFVLLDEQLVGVLPLSRPLLISPGEHTVRLELNGAHLEDQVRIPLVRQGELRANFATRALLLTVLPGVLLLEEGSGLSAADQTKQDALVEKALLAQRLSPIGSADALECGGEPAPGACSEALRCQIELAQHCEADYILRTRWVQDPRTPFLLRVELEIIDVAIGDVAASDALECSGCTPEQLLASLEGHLAPLVERAVGRTQGHLEISSQPAGAAVLIDDRTVGATPYQAVVFTGPHRIELHKEGYQVFKTPVEVKEEGAAQLAVPLLPLPSVQLDPVEPPPAASVLPPRRPRWRLLGGGIGMGIGLLVSGFGVSALSLNSTQTVTQCGDLTSADRVCIYHTQNVGIGLLVSGLTVAVGAAILIAIPGTRPSSRGKR